MTTAKEDTETGQVKLIRILSFRLMANREKDKFKSNIDCPFACSLLMCGWLSCKVKAEVRSSAEI